MQNAIWPFRIVLRIAIFVNWQETDEKEEEVSAPQIFAQTQEQQDSVLAVDKAEEDNDKEDQSNPETDQDAEMKEPHDTQQNKLNKVQLNSSRHEAPYKYLVDTLIRQ